MTRVYSTHSSDQSIRPTLFAFTHQISLSAYIYGYINLLHIGYPSPVHPWSD
jgi:hypothetical protein